jgi:hypothetical protein
MRGTRQKRGTILNNRIGYGTAPAPIVAVTMRAAWSDATRKLLARDEIMRRVLRAPDGASIRQIEAIVRTSPPSQRIFGDPRVEVAQRRLRVLDAEVRQVGDELVMRWSTKGADASGDVECISSAHLLERFDVEVAHDDEIQWSRWRDGQRTAVTSASADPIAARSRAAAIVRGARSGTPMNDTSDGEPSNARGAQ